MNGLVYDSVWITLESSLGENCFYGYWLYQGLHLIFSKWGLETIWDILKHDYWIYRNFFFASQPSILYNIADFVLMWTLTVLLCLRLQAPEALCFRVVCPSVQSLKYLLLTCTWVRWSTRPTVTVLRHVRPSVRLSVRPSGEVSGHLVENAWREWPEIFHAGLS